MAELKVYFDKVNDLFSRFIKGDKIIWITVLLLSMLSLVAVYSSSSYLALTQGVSKTAIFLDQFKMVLLGWGALFIGYIIPPKRYRQFSILLYLASIFLLLLLFVPGLRAIQNGAIRGIKIGGQTLQVFEFAKVGIILYLARAFEIFRPDTLKDFALKFLLPVAVTCLLILRGTFSGAVFVGFICFLIFIINGVKWKFLGMTVLAAVILMGFAIAAYKITEDNPEGKRMFVRFETAVSRLEQFTQKDSDMENTANLSEAEMQKLIDKERQSENANIAIHEGGLIGKGPGKSTQRYALSMAFSDFIFAFIVEEYGAIIGLFVIILYIGLFSRCCNLALKCNSAFFSTAVLGFGLLTTAQALMHIMVNVGLFPVTGHTLPLVSHGGTAFLVFSGIMGIILSVSKNIKINE